MTARGLWYKGSVAHTRRLDPFVARLIALAVGLVALTAVILSTLGAQRAEPAAGQQSSPTVASGAAADGKDTAPSSSTTTSTACTGGADQCMAQSAFEQPVGPAVDRKKLGWGAAQPYSMNATVMGGSTDTPITPERRALLGRQLEQARAAALRVGTVAEAEREGFVRNWQRIDGRGWEYVNWDRIRNQTTLDLDKPTMLLFADDKPDSTVISVAYQVRGTREAGPPKDLPLELIPWHFHHNLCAVDGQVIGNVETDQQGNLIESGAKRCEAAGATYLPELDHWMVDLWVIPGWENPWGLVSSKHPDEFSDPRPYFPYAPTPTGSTATGTTSTDTGHDH